MATPKHDDSTTKTVTPLLRVARLDLAREAGQHAQVHGVGWAGTVLDPDGSLAKMAAGQQIDVHEFWLKRVMMRRYSWLRPRFDLPVRAQPTAEAFVVSGVWVAQCPGCAGAEYLWGEDDWFVCCSCGNAQYGGERLAVYFTAPAQAVMAELAKRERVEHRISAPGQSLAEMQRETVALAKALATVE